MSARLLVGLLASGLLLLTIGVFVGMTVTTVPGTPLATLTPAPPTATATPVPTATPIPTATPPPTATPVPTPTPRIITGATVVHQIQQVSRLETTSYSIQTVVTVERPGGLLGVGSQRLLVIVRGTVVAGIDVGKLQPRDVTVSEDGRQVAVRLPPAEILSTSLDERQTQVYDHQTGLFTRPDSSLVVEAQQAGAAQVLRTACEDGILRRATGDAQRAVTQMLTLVGFERVLVEDGTAPPCPSTAAPAPTTTPQS